MSSRNEMTGLATCDAAGREGEIRLWAGASGVRYNHSDAIPLPGTPARTAPVPQPPAPPFQQNQVLHVYGRSSRREFRFYDRLSDIYMLWGRPNIAWPTDHFVITDDYFPQATMNHRRHTAIDIRAFQGDNVYATNEGQVSEIFCDYIFGAGSVIRIANDDGTQAAYAHTAARNGLHVGDRVAAGDLIGNSDGSGGDIEEPQESTRDRPCDDGETTGVAPHTHYVYKRPLGQRLVRADPLMRNIGAALDNPLSTLCWQDLSDANIPLRQYNLFIPFAVCN